MRKVLRSWLLLGLISTAGACELASADEHAFTRLNAVGRYLGVGYSHHGYHSGPSARLQVVQQNYPASAYPSTYRPSPYLPAEFAYRPQRSVSGYPLSPGPSLAPQLTTPNVPTLAPEPIGPPPKWLEPHLREDEATLPTPAPAKSKTPKSPAASTDDRKLFEEPVEASPSDRPVHLKERSSPTLSTDSSSRENLPLGPPQPASKPAAASPSQDNLLDDLDDDQLLDGRDNDSLLDGEDGLQADARNRHPSPAPRYATPEIRSNINRYTPFR